MRHDMSSMASNVVPWPPTARCASMENHVSDIGEEGSNYMQGESDAPDPAEPTPDASCTSRWKQAASPIVTAVIGLVLLSAGFALNPPTIQPAALGYSLLKVSAKSPISEIEYGVSQVSATTAEVLVEVAVSPDLANSVRMASIELSPPIGTSFTQCPAPVCTATIIGSSARAHSWYSWTKTLAVSHGRARTSFMVRASSFGEETNSAIASAAIPEVFDDAPGEASLLVDYTIPSARNFDWSSSPAVIAGDQVFWHEEVTSRGTAGRVADGTNDATLASDVNKIFAEGILMALAATALLSAALEALDGIKLPSRMVDVNPAMRPRTGYGFAWLAGLRLGEPDGGRFRLRLRTTTSTMTATAMIATTSPTATAMIQPGSVI